jgi:hypothetical protein
MSYAYEIASYAWWYAIGRKDAGAKVDADAFAAHYEKLTDDLENGRTSFRPSVQDAFATYVKENS